MTATVEELLQSPRFPAFVDELQRLLADERARRERFYQELTEDTNAEFINGQVIMQSPATYGHVTAVKLLSKLLDSYVERHGLGYVGTEKMLIVLPRNDYEPDVCFFGKEKATQLTAAQLKFPAPDFIAEVLSPTTEERDRGVKFEDYAANGVAEYWLVNPALEQVEQFSLREGRFVPVGTFAGGQIKSHVVEGFAIPVRAIFDAQVNLRTLSQFVQPLSN
jgi:Uma2 family endonuclease